MFLQASYFERPHSKALEVLGIDATRDAAGVDRDAAGRATGRLNEAGFRALVGKLPTASEDEVEASTLGMIRELNRAGLTTFGSSGCEADLLTRYRKWADQIGSTSGSSASPHRVAAATSINCCPGSPK